ncbi:MAG: acetolactate decarboxylase [Candidatus Bathyarchaeota archaeon]|nr:acetolactate decarboxylase [Candidatus Bathyarchaeota archaeon]
MAETQTIKKRLIFRSILLVALLAVAGVLAYWQMQPTSDTADKYVLFQVAAFNSFAEGNYSGFYSYGDLAEHGDFGIGTFNNLDGEMVALDGKFYQVPMDGIPIQVDASYTAPYATVTFFEADQTIPVTEQLNYTGLLSFISTAFPDQNSIYAIKVAGNFSYAQTRSVPTQSEPYPPLSVPVANQAVFNLTNVEATAVGFWFPNSMDGVDYAGFHLHMITTDYQAGGHLLDCVIENVTVEIDQIKTYQLILAP